MDPRNYPLNLYKRPTYQGRIPIRPGPVRPTGGMPTRPTGGIFGGGAPTYQGRIPIRALQPRPGVSPQPTRRLINFGRPTSGLGIFGRRPTYPGTIPVRTLQPRPGISPQPVRPSITIRPRPTPTITPRPLFGPAPVPGAPAPTVAGLFGPAPTYTGQIPVVPAAGAPGLAAAPGLGLGGLGGGLGGIGTSLSTGVGGILSVARSYVPLAIKAIIVLLIIKIAIWIMRRR